MRLRERLWNPCATVFFSSACIMVIELVASRMIAPRLGVSLYTWTSVIGVILAGISVGNYLGGRLSDQRGSFPFLGLVLALASIASLGILWLSNDLSEANLPKSFPFMARVVGYIAGVFFVPSALLGCVSPIVVKLGLTSLDNSGATVGKIYAWSSVGSIVGTFATGFYLISWFGTKIIVLIVSGLLMLMALWFLTCTRLKKALLWAALALCAFGLSAWLLNRGGFLGRECLLETNYYCIKVSEEDIGGRTVRSLVLDRLVHSYSDPDDPTYLVYGYERAYAQVIQPLMERKPNLEALFIGGGGYTFPRYLEATLPQSRLVVSEIDPRVTEVAQARLGLDPATRIQTHNLDARVFVALHCEPDSYDVVFGDAFNDFSVPFHLTTLEFDRLVDRLLRDDGLYVVNIVDGGRRGHFMRAYVHTLRQVFPHVAVIPSGDDWRESVRTTFVIVAGHQPLDLSHLPAGSQPLGEEELEAYLSLDPPLILTDEYVPVDNLLAPVFEDSYRG